VMAHRAKSSFSPMVGRAYCLAENSVLSDRLLGKRVNPRHGRVMRKISDENQSLASDIKEWSRRRSKIEYL
jgi:hypothetical protein